jgi:hypothetical protein
MHSIPDCHPERSEESGVALLPVAAKSNRSFRCAQNDNLS